MDEIRRTVLLGGLAPGESLPSAQALAADVGVNPNTVRQAYRGLARDGVLEVRRGKGTFVSASGAVDETGREMVRRRVARRALRDAYRHGLNLEDLLATLREVAAPRSNE